METKHTPGNFSDGTTGWRIKERKIGDATHEIHYSDDGECIAEVVHGEANAKLISAAPDMLAALQKAERRLESLQTYFTSQNFTDRYGDADANAGCLLVIKDAIKKATS